MKSLTEIYNDCVAINNTLTMEYGENYNVSVAYLEVNHIYIANVKDCRDKDVRGFMFDLSLQRIQTPTLEKVEAKDEGLFGVINGVEYQLVRQFENNAIVYKINNKEK